MGRFRRKRFFRSCRNSNGPPPADTLERSLATGDRKYLVRYLQEYQEGALCLLRGKRLTSLDTEETPTIFEQNFPVLTAETLRQPYLELPSGLSDKQRKTVHEECFDLGLYHISVGLQKLDRCVVISIYRDGFEYLPGFQEQKGQYKNAHRLHTLSQLKPWVLRQRNKLNDSETEIDPKEVTRRGREAVSQFVYHPGKALRDGIDFLDFPAMESEDLSQTTPPTFESDDWMLVDSPDKMKECVKELTESGTTEIAFDLECYNQSKYLQVTCLIQLAASNGREYVIDPLAPGVWDSVNLLAPLFLNPNIVKIGHSIGGLDIRSLHRDFGIFVVNAFDTYEAASCLSLPRKGLSKVCDYYGLPNCSIYESLKHQYQTTDWTHRPLTEPMIRYGRYDVHYLIQLRRLMMRDLAKRQLWEKNVEYKEAHQVGSSMFAMLRNFQEDEEAFLGEATEEPGYETPIDEVSVYEDAMEEESIQEKRERQSLFGASELRRNLDLMRAISRSQERCLDIWTDSQYIEPALGNPDFQSLVCRARSSGGGWTPSQLQLYEDLARWRNKIAAQRGCAPSFVCSLGFLASVAFKRPTNKFSLQRISFDLPEILNSPYCAMDEVFALIRHSRTRDGLAEDEDLSLFPSFQKPKTQHPQWSTILGLAGCAAVVVVASVHRSRNRRR